MPEPFIKPAIFEERITKPKPKDIFESISSSKTITEKINVSYEDAAKTESEINKTKLDENIKSLTETNLKVIETTSTTLGEKFDISDPEPLENFQKTIMDNFNKPIDQVADTLKTSESSIKPENISTMRNLLNTIGTSIQTNFEKVLAKTDPINSASYKSAVSDLTIASESLDKALNGTDNTAIKNAKVNFDRAQAKLETVLESSENLKLETKASGQDWKTTKEIIKFSLYFCAMIGTLIGAFFLLPKALTGCYLFINKGGNISSYKLEGCSEWYDQTNNQNYCGCKTKVAPSQDVNPDCTKFTNDSNQPYCIGYSNTNPKCQFPYAIRYQCNTITDYTKDGAIWYSYQLYTPLSLLSEAVNGAANIYNSLPSANGIVKYLIIGGAIIGGLFLLFILLMILKK